MKPIHQRSPDEIVTMADEHENGCYSCSWRRYIKERRKMGCDAGQGYYPIRGACTWYKRKR